MEKIKIASKTAKIRIFSNSPSFQYSFEQADIPQQVDKEHSEKILKNDNFYISDKSLPKPKKMAEKQPNNEKTWSEELNDIKGIGNKTAMDILRQYPNKGLLLKALADKKELSFRDDVVILLKQQFIH